MRRTAVISSVALVILVGGILCACSPTRTASVRRNVRVPVGWKTYTYGRAKISVPGKWAVITDYVCPEFRPEGALYLGPPRELGAGCAGSGQEDSVTIEPIPPGLHFQGETCRDPAKVNGLIVYIPHCASSDPSGSISWAIPLLDLMAVVTTPSTENAAADGTSTTVGRALNTIRRR